MVQTYFDTFVGRDAEDSVFLAGDEQVEDRSVVSPQHPDWFPGNGSDVKCQ